MRIRLALGAVADQPADVLVRVAPSALISRRADPVLDQAGPAVAAACRVLRKQRFPGGVPVSEAVITPAGELAARWVVHVVVPGYTVQTDRAYLLASAYRACLREADAVGARTVAMPALGAWPPFWPLAEATRIGVGTLESTMTGVREVSLVLATASSFEVFAEALARR